MNDSNSTSPVINLSEAIIHKIGWILLAICLVFIIIGGFVSPVDDQDRPILLLPDVKAVEAYRQSAQGWIDNMSVLDSEISALLSSEPQGDLFFISRMAQQTLQDAVELAQEIDRKNVPPIAMGVHEQFVSTSLIYLEAARQTMQWVGSPQETIHIDAVSALDEARMMKNSLEENLWLITP
jgi:hypothetical protein